MPLAGQWSSVIDKRLEELCARWVAQFFERLGLDLTDTFARDIKLMPDFFKRMVAVLANTEAHAKHVFFTLREAGEYFARLLCEVARNDGIRRSHDRPTAAKGAER